MRKEWFFPSINFFSVFQKHLLSFDVGAVYTLYFTFIRKFALACKIARLSKRLWLSK